MNIGKSIRTIRLEKGLTQKELALKSKVSENAIKQYESGKRQPKMEYLMKISSALNVNLIDLISSSESQSQHENKFSMLRAFGLDNESIALNKLKSSNFPNSLSALENYGYKLTFDVNKNKIFLENNNNTYCLTHNFLNELDKTIDFTLKLKLEELKKEGE